MATITISRHWCDQDLMDCYFARDDQTLSWTHVGAGTIEIADYMNEKKAQGWWSRHLGDGTYQLYRRASMPLNQPQLDWLMATDAMKDIEPRYVDVVEQDW